VHALVEQSISVGNPTITTASRTTQASGSSLVVCAARGETTLLLASTISDNKGNTPFVQRAKRNYDDFPGSAAGLYTFLNAAGGSGHTLTLSNLSSDEGTLAFVEVKNGLTVQDVNSSNAGSSGSLVSPTVTTTGPATIVAFCAGGGSSGISSYGGVSNGFTLLDSYGATDALSVQVAAASRDVSGAGTYGLTWTISPAQNALLFIIAIGA